MLKLGILRTLHAQLCCSCWRCEFDSGLQRFLISFLIFCYFTINGKHLTENSSKKLNVIEMKMLKLKLLFMQKGSRI